MDYLEAVLLGLLTSVTRVLPISSTGHMMLASWFVGRPLTVSAAFQLAVECGMFLSVAWVLRLDILRILVSTTLALIHPFRLVQQYRTDAAFRLAVRFLVACIPTVAGPIVLGRFDVLAFKDPKMVSTMIIVTGLMLHLTRVISPKVRSELGITGAFVVGIAQAVSLVPGLSRSGATISFARYFGSSPEESVRFSFLLFLPALVGVIVLNGFTVASSGIGGELVVLIIAGVVGCAGSFGALKFFLRTVAHGSFRLYAIYCLIVGILGIIFI